MALLKSSLVAEGISQVVADAGFVRFEALGGAIFGDGILQFALIVKDDTQIAVGLPEIGTQAERVAISDGGAPQVSLIAVGDPDIEVHVGIRRGTFRFANERFFKGMQGGIVTAIGIEREAEITIGFGVGGIHAEGGARLG